MQARRAIGFLVFSALCPCFATPKALRIPMAVTQLPAVYRNSKPTIRPETCVAVIDTGIDFNHKSFADTLYTNPGETAENTAQGLDGDHNGYGGDLHGWDFIDNDPFPFEEDYDILDLPIVQQVTGVDSSKLSEEEKFWFRLQVDTNPIINMYRGPDNFGHGTHVAGIVHRASITRCVLPIRSLVDWASLAEVVDYVASLGVRVVNMSFGSFEHKMDSVQLAGIDKFRQAMARHPELFFVMISHNHGLNLHEAKSGMFPSNISIPNKIVVGAVDSGGILADFSNVGECFVDVYAPGVEVSSAAVGGGEIRMSGTSMAAPYIAGIAARILTEYPNSDADEIRRRILAYSKDRELEFVDKENPKNRFKFTAPVIL